MHTGSPSGGLSIRPEIRYDAAFSTGGAPFSDRAEDFLLAVERQFRYTGKQPFMHNLRQSLDVSITCWNLLNHPFYRAWSDGTLPVEKLKRYAAEYGNYIATIANSWRTAGEAEIATEEETHLDMWKKFAKSIGTEVRRPSLRETKTLVALSSECGSDRARVLGSLYAFEAQQPHTAASKQQGLEKFYPQLCADDSYFRVHMNEHHEPEILLRRMETISPADQRKTVGACEKTARALWDTLTAIDRADDV